MMIKKLYSSLEDDSVQSLTSPSTTTPQTKTPQLANTIPQQQDIQQDDIQQDDEEEDEYEELELDYLSQSDFVNTEWKIGTLPRDGKTSSDIITTWVRLLPPVGDPTKFGGGKQSTQWGDGSKGTWSFDVSGQFLSISKESPLGLLGKDIWACEVNDYYYLEGAVRGWKPWAAADVKGQWQGIRLGVEEEERGESPWEGRTEEDDGRREGEGDEGE